ADESVKGIARIDRADNQIGIIELRCSAIPVRLEDSVHCLYVLRVSIDDIIFSIAETAAATGTAQGRARKIGGHDIGGSSIDDHAFLVRQGKAGIAILHFG